MESFAEDMNTSLFGNPHSQSPSSMRSTVRINRVRARMLEFFKADAEFFDLIFVANATAAIKMVMDGMRDHDSFWYGYHAESHTSLVGVREVASKGSRCFTSDSDVETWLSNDAASLIRPSFQSKTTEDIGLFAYPAQSNMNGRRLPLSWPGRLRASNLKRHHQVYSLLDAAAFVSTAQLDLSDWENAPDFTALSFYKIFGFPDLGALLVRKDAGQILNKRRYFGGGTVDMVINAIDEPKEAWFARKNTSAHEAFEDGTPAFHSIIALDSAVEIHQRLYTSMDHVSRHTNHLIQTLYQRFSALSHRNGAPLCTIYHDANSKYGDGKTQGPTIAFNIRDRHGRWIGKSQFEESAIANGIQLRTGGVCNPGGIAQSLNFTPQEMRHNFDEGLRCGNELDELNGKPTGIIRVSLGAMSNVKDINTLIDFMSRFIDLERQDIGVPTVGNWDSKGAVHTAVSLSERKASIHPRATRTARTAFASMWKEQNRSNMGLIPQFPLYDVAGSHGVKPAPLECQPHEPVSSRGSIEKLLDRLRRAFCN
ncbi:hypothetical protein MMC07_000040 [Pseudocyphellaria aurata]|nr:hypothetical protein [Pseudocyphellaria aurata]